MRIRFGTENPFQLALSKREILTQSLSSALGTMIETRRKLSAWGPMNQLKMFVGTVSRVRFPSGTGVNLAASGCGNPTHPPPALNMDHYSAVFRIRRILAPMSLCSRRIQWKNQMMEETEISSLFPASWRAREFTRRLS